MALPFKPLATTVIGGVVFLLPLIVVLAVLGQLPFVGGVVALLAVVGGTGALALLAAPRQRAAGWRSTATARYPQVQAVPMYWKLPVCDWIFHPSRWHSVSMSLALDSCLH